MERPEISEAGKTWDGKLSGQVRPNGYPDERWAKTLLVRYFDHLRRWPNDDPVEAASVFEAYLLKYGLEVRDVRN